MDYRQSDTSSACFQIWGDIDLANSTALSRELGRYCATTTGTVVIDCTNMTYLDSSGLQVLLDVQRQLDALARPVSLRHLNRACRNLFRLTGTEARFQIETDPTGT
jgi:anti-sigma B factor antagonist